MEESLPHRILIQIENYIESFENEKFHEKNEARNLGIIYTPHQVANFIVSNIFRIYFEKFIHSKKRHRNNLSLEEIFLSIIENQKLKEKLSKTIQNLRILDPSCGSGRFLISIAENLYQFYRILEPDFSDFDIKKKIIQKNLFGIEIENSAIIISKLRLIKWLLSTNITNKIFQNLDLESFKLTNLDNTIEHLNIEFNIFTSDFLLEFSSDKFDFIIGNPPFVENKKIKDIKFKKRLINRYKTAYRLFDLSILFVERSLELLENDGYLSFIF